MSASYPQGGLLTGLLAWVYNGVRGYRKLTSSQCRKQKELSAILKTRKNKKSILAVSFFVQTYR